MNAKDKNPNRGRVSNPSTGPKPRKRGNNPTRPDKAMESALEANRVCMARARLDPDNLPWATKNGILYNVHTGQRLGSAPDAGHEPYFDRWHHRRTGE